MDKEPSKVMSKLWHGLARTGSRKIGLRAEDPYEFQPLRPSTTIRLIKICRRRVKGCIACRIYHFREFQQERLQYQALSYVWGNSKATRQIFLEGPDNRWHPFFVHENLWRFLEHAWRQKMFDQLFWTDRLCLDQDSHEEISQQVPRMRTIYQSAELVLIWLNLKEEEERFLLELLRLYPFSNRDAALCYEIEQRRATFNQATFLQLVENPYWTRVWIVQEVVVARRVCVTCQDNLIPLEELAFLFSRFWEGSMIDKPRIWALCNMRDATTMSRKKSLKLSTILMDSQFSRYQSSRPADRLYGMLGLVQGNKDGSSPTDNIQVDYGKPILHILLDAMFEASPDRLHDCIRLPRCLGGRNTYDSHSLLESYITDSKTTQRHKEFAQLALQTLEAVKIINSVPGAPGKDVMLAISHDGYLSSTARGRARRPTTAQCAAIIGIVIARSSSGPLAHWKARRRSRGEASSPWRCVAHQSVDITPRGVPSYESLIRISQRGSWDRERVVEACGERSPGCDGAIMTCEIPQVGLRLYLPLFSPGEPLILQRRE